MNSAMSNKTQKQAFLDYEANNWFSRNRSSQYNPKKDPVLAVLREYSITAGHVFEIGCSYGYRLNAISQSFEDVKVTGLEPSLEAIEYGRQKYSSVNFVHGTADDISMIPSASFDLVIIGFVLYVIDRDVLLRVVSETDRVLKNNGILMILDFFSEKALRNPYDHIKELVAYSYKQNYEDVFTASKLYQLIDKRSFHHATKKYDIEGDYYNTLSLCTLRKDTSAGYVDK